MINRNRFSELSESLTSGFFADNAVFVLSKIKKGMPQTTDDTRVLQEIKAFLENVLNGFHWSDNPRFSSRSTLSASAFSQAVQAIQLHVGQDSQAFSNSVNEYKRTVEQLLGGESVDSAKLQSLINFFSAIGKTQLKRTDSIINVRTSGSRGIFSFNK